MNKYLGALGGYQKKAN